MNLKETKNYINISNNSQNLLRAYIRACIKLLDVYIITLIPYNGPNEVFTTS